VSTKPAAGGGRWVDVVPERLERWIAGFHERHDVVSTTYEPDTVRFDGVDGAVADCHVPFPPLSETGCCAGLDTSPLLGHVQRDRFVAVLLVRLGGYAAGVFDGSRLVASKTGSRLVHGRSAAGGQSQRRFARRREGQAREAVRAASDTAARVLLPYVDDLDAVVLGGDRRAVEAVRSDVRLEPLFKLAVDRFLTVPDPKRKVLEDTPRQFRAIRIRVA
jgi:hypothetical protein